jgi:hypothetical protein
MNITAANGQFGQLIIRRQHSKKRLEIDRKYLGRSGDPCTTRGCPGITTSGQHQCRCCRMGRQGRMEMAVRIVDGKHRQTDIHYLPALLHRLNNRPDLHAEFWYMDGKFERDFRRNAANILAHL